MFFPFFCHHIYWFNTMLTRLTCKLLLCVICSEQVGFSLSNMFQYSNLTFTKGRGKISAMKGVLYFQHLSCCDKLLQYFLPFMFLASLLIYAHKRLFFFFFLPESMLEMVIEVESCLFDNCNFTVIEKLSANNTAHLIRGTWCVMGVIQKYYY